MLRSVHHQASPTTAEVEEALARAQSQLAANIIELAFLGYIQIVIRCGEVGTTVDHIRVEPEFKKLVGLVVVVTDSLPVTLLRVNFAVQSLAKIIWARLPCFGQAHQAFSKAQLLQLANMSTF